MKGTRLDGLSSAPRPESVAIFCTKPVTRMVVMIVTSITVRDPERLKPPARPNCVRAFWITDTAVCVSYVFFYFRSRRRISIRIKNDVFFLALFLRFPISPSATDRHHDRATFVIQRPRGNGT